MKTVTYFHKSISKAAKTLNDTTITYVISNKKPSSLVKSITRFKQNLRKAKKERLLTYLCVMHSDGVDFDLIKSNIEQRVNATEQTWAAPAGFERGVNLNATT